MSEKPALTGEFEIVVDDMLVAGKEFQRIKPVERHEGIGQYCPKWSPPGHWIPSTQMPEVGRLGRSQGSRRRDGTVLLQNNRHPAKACIAAANVCLETVLAAPFDPLNL